MQYILFEDHTFRHFRPLAWSQPTYELRCGLFNTRERVDLVTDGSGGLLLCREILRPLHQAPGWQLEPKEIGERSLWLNGRLAPRGELLDQLKKAAGHDWALWDEHGLLAACLAPGLGRTLLESWQAWEGDCGLNNPWQPRTLLGQLAAPELPDTEEACGLPWIWDIVSATSQAIESDLALVAGGRMMERHPFGLVPGPDATWQAAGSLRRVANGVEPDGVVVGGRCGLYLGSAGVEIAAGVHIDTTSGPVVLDSGVCVMPHTFLSGPLYVGRQSIIKAGARIYGESSFGVGNRLAGEIGESTFGEFANKQHDGFIGHAVLGSWINLGAGTTCSDLKNNYGEVRVDLGDGPVGTGQRFVGLMAGDHAKTAIGSMFNTGTVVGFASNIFGAQMPPKFVPGFSWGGQAGAPVYDGDRAQETAAVVMRRRGCHWREDHARLFGWLHEMASG